MKKLIVTVQEEHIIKVCRVLDAVIGVEEYECTSNIIFPFIEYSHIVSRIKLLLYEWDKYAPNQKDVLSDILSEIQIAAEFAIGVKDNGLSLSRND